VFNDSAYGNVRRTQLEQFDGRLMGTDLLNPDFTAYARAFGAHGASVERSEDFAEAFEDAVASGLPAVIELRVDPEAITPRQTLSELRDAGS
jgi:acetolactate synthase-1/2/3 large subunit